MRRPFRIVVVWAWVAAGRALAAETGAPLDADALKACLALEQQARALHERHARELADVEAEGRSIDADRAALERRRGATDRHDPTAVAAYNQAAAAFDARVRAHNASLDGVRAAEAAQREAATRFNAQCAGQRFRPADLRAQ